jgi:beta-lactamase class A
MTITSRLVIAFALAAAAVTAPVAASDPAAQTQAPAPAKAIDITGRWAASFETEVGTQTYTYDFIAKDGRLTGKIKGSLSEAAVDVTEGKVEGDTVKFVEHLTFQGMELVITYTGKIASADEIRFSRQVSEIATEELIAKRVKAAK